MFFSVIILLCFTPNLISSQASNYTQRAELMRSIAETFQKNGLFTTRKGSDGFNYWEHDGPNNWPKKFPRCGGRFQSPINIETSQLEYRKIKRPLKWSNFDKEPAYISLEKSDVSLGISTIWKNKWEIPYISGGPLTEKYYFYHLHFHWNIATDLGSEHTVNGKRFPLEVHVVFTTNVEGALDDENKILVVGYMATVGGKGKANKGLSEIVESLKNMKGEASEVTAVPPFSFKEFDLEFCEDYVIYSGSLTTPPCTPGVTWIMSSRPLTLSLDEYVTMKRILSQRKENSTTNSRYTQPLNDRKVFYIKSHGCPNNDYSRDSPNEI